MAKSRESYGVALNQLLVDARSLGEEIATDTAAYKTNHVILGMLTATEWYQLMEMHFRHHLRQKEELEHFLSA